MSDNTSQNPAGESDEAQAPSEELTEEQLENTSGGTGFYYPTPTLPKKP